MKITYKEGNPNKDENRAGKSSDRFVCLDH